MKKIAQHFSPATILLLFCLISSPLLGQDDDAGQIDASKPTNFYSFLDNTLELTNSPGQNVFGYRGKLTLAPSEAHLVLAEIPLLYNDRTSRFGLGDIRARYFWLPYKNYDRFIGAFGPSIDVFAPVGSFEDGIGSGRWTVSPGVTVGLMAADWIQFFPILSYQYQSKPVYDNPLPAADRDRHGVTFQVITPLVFSEVFFVQITPILRLNDIGDERFDRFVQEIFAAYSLAEKKQLSLFYSGNFEDKVHQAGLGLTIFF